MTVLRAEKWKWYGGGPRCRLQMNHQNANDGRKVEMLFGQLQCRPQMKPRARVTCGNPTSLAPGVGLAQFSKCTVHTSALHLAGSPTGDSYAFRRTQTPCMSF